MTQTRTCYDLGVCQGHGCPDCEAFECEVACSPEPARPTFPFAPGVIQRAPQGSYVDQDGAWLPLSLGETVKLLCLLAALSGLAGYLVEKFA